MIGLERRRAMMAMERIEIVDHIILKDGARITIPIEQKDYFDSDVVYHVHREGGFGNKSANIFELRNAGILSIIFAMIGNSINTKVNIVACYMNDSAFINASVATAKDIKITFQLKETLQETWRTIQLYVDDETVSMATQNTTNYFSAIGDAVVIRNNNYEDAQFKYLQLGTNKIYPAKCKEKYGVVCNGRFYGNSAEVGYITI